ncbi:phosphoribosylformylglycinamidine cyclo-ligase [Petrotoga sp. 9PWA.NaAc.5.4]|uniref:phosphoribosylformylglycinamidine cyclo-ligase n=1 Tax=Petrotoga sp. 9PWA.NaAc.5.4 TaxID=1434328 RepID=UPI000CAA3EB8|nr:phosphoribosylformylglycinamidine cyclo-ligase [Petrotoga sp. 9PWA.NaAc.5.4]PNR92815.1 phosphoribosylformylglycinamidine cyclo-ligase [Petrotoga sp. 9PWA.NaAc.5.4]
MYYKESGVDVNKANEAIKEIKELVGDNIGAYAGIFPLYDFLAFNGYTDPVLVATTDGIGTKLELLKEHKMWDIAAIDLVAMNLNDLVCMGAKPLFFLDYFATSSLHKNDFICFIKNLTGTLKKYDCKLLGGETAELPGIFYENQEDVAGFAVGIAEKEKMFDYSKIKTGDKLIGLTSSGIHSNGYSLVRKLLKDQKLAYKNYILNPTRVYVDQTLRIRDYIKGAAHITGGGIIDNLGRIIPNGYCANIKVDWEYPKVFHDIMDAGVSLNEMFKVFNMGVGMIYIMNEDNLTKVKEILEIEFSETVLLIGEISNCKSVEEKVYLEF